LSDVRTIAFPSIGDATPEHRGAQAEARGHAAGYAAGIRVAQAEIDALHARLTDDFASRVAVLEQVTAARLAALDAAVAALDARTAPVLADAEASMVAAAFELAEAVVGHQIALEARDGSGARAAVARALASVDPALATAVRLAPADAAALSDVELPVRVVVDHGLSRGDAVVDLPDGTLDARIGAALGRARTALGLDAATLADAPIAGGAR
jgi:flagellar assembly protein FliH